MKSVHETASPFIIVLCTTIYLRRSNVTQKSFNRFTILMLLASVASPVVADPPETARIWVSYKDSSGPDVLKMLTGNGAKFIMTSLNWVPMWSVFLPPPSMVFSITLCY